MTKHWSTNPLRKLAWEVSQWMCRRMLETNSSAVARFWRTLVRLCPEGRPREID